MKKLVLFGSFLACAFAFAGIEYSADGKSATVTGLTTLTSAGQLPDVETLTLSAGSVLSLDGIDAFTLKANIEGSGPAAGPLRRIRQLVRSGGQSDSADHGCRDAAHPQIAEWRINPVGTLI